MRPLVQLTMACHADGCDGRVRMRRARDGTAELVGVCRRCGETSRCTLHPDGTADHGAVGRCDDDHAAAPPTGPAPPAEPEVRRGRRHGRRGPSGSALALVAALALVVSVAGVVVLAPPAAAAGTAVMRPARVTAAQIVTWFRLRSPGDYRATVPVEQLVDHFLDEGAAQGVAGDIAFAQSVLETGWFRFSAGSVRPEDNNFAGLGATGVPGEVASFPTAQIGVRAQIQHLWAYADPDATADGTARPLVDPRFDLVVPKGKAPTWEEMGSGSWAADPDYGAKVLLLYADLLAVSGVPLQRFVTAAFVDVLRRTPDPASLAWWTDATAVRGRGWTARALATGSEATSVWIRARYVQLLDRPPTPDALAWRTSLVDGGAPLADVVVALAASAEAYRLAGGTDEGWVAELYRDLLGRTVDAPALAHWVGALAAGTTDRSRVVRSIWASAESRGVRVRALYLGLLDRPADAGGLAWWTDRLRTVDDLAATAELIGSAEYFTLAQA